MSTPESHLDNFRDDNNRPDFVDAASGLPEKPACDPLLPEGNGKPLSTEEEIRFQMLRAEFNRATGRHAMRTDILDNDTLKRNREALRKPDATEEQ